MTDAYITNLRTARMLFANHWLSHARQKCEDAMNCEAENYLEVKDLMSEIDERSRSPSVFLAYPVVTHTH